VVEADDGAGAGGFVGSDAAERNNIFDAGVSDGGRDGVAGTILITESIVAGSVGRNHDVG